MPTHLKRSRISIEWIVIQKKTIRRLIFGILGIPLIAFILFIVVRNYLINSEFTPTQPSSSAYFLEIRGNVTVKRATTNAIEVATKNTTISPGDTIHTNPEAVARIKYPDGTEFSIRSGATIIFKGDSGANIDRKIENRLENGTVTVTTQQNSSTHIVYLSNAKTIMQEEVDTRLTVNQGGKDTVEVNKGKVEVVSQQGTEILSQQQRADIVDNKIKMVELPSAPRLRFPVSTDQIVMQRDRRNKVEFTWNPVPNASKYRIELSSVPSFPESTILATESSLQNTRYVWTKPSEGRFYWRVQAITRDGVEGKWSESPAFSVKLRMQNIPVKIKLTKIEVYGPALISIEGTTKPGAILRINSRIQTQANDKGLFQADISFSRKTRQFISIVALDSNGNTGSFYKQL